MNFESRPSGFAARRQRGGRVMAWHPVAILSGDRMVQLGFSRRSKWTDAKSVRLVTAWNSNVAMAQLAARFGVFPATVMNKLVEARKAGLPVADHKARNFYG
ncbi:MAG: hypothetical protein ACREC0_03125 [Methylocella sp.]